MTENARTRESPWVHYVRIEFWRWNLWLVVLPPEALERVMVRFREPLQTCINEGGQQLRNFIFNFDIRLRIQWRLLIDFPRFPQFFPITRLKTNKLHFETWVSEMTKQDASFNANITFLSQPVLGIQPFEIGGYILPHPVFHRREFYRLWWQSLGRGNTIFSPMCWGRRGILI